MTSNQNLPYELHNDEGVMFQSMGALVSIKATSEQTRGVFNLFEVLCPPGFSTSHHIHYCEDVAIYVLEGALTFFLGIEKKVAFAGSFSYHPRCTPHGFRVAGESSARILYITIPAGFDQFVKEQQQPNQNHVPGTVAALYKIEILGPLPE